MTWNAPFGAPNTTNMKITLINGTIDHKATVTDSVRAHETKSYIVDRDDNGVGGRLYMTVSIYGDVSDPPLDIPKIPNFKIVVKPKLMPEPPQLTGLCRSGGCGTAKVTIGTDIYPDKDATLLPETFTFLTDHAVGPADHTYACPNPDKNAKPSLCANYDPKLNDSKHTALFSGMQEQIKKITRFGVAFRS